jgi:hypothetical protein
MKTIDTTKQSKCCPNTEVVVRRFILDHQSKSFSAGSIFYMNSVLTPNIVSFKALSHANGVRNSYNVKRVGLIGSSGRIGQTVQAAGSYALPGDISPLRSPIRSGLFTAITPGLPGGGRPRMSTRDRTARCPEGYQYGGRFTDNEMSTCGAQLFDIPGPLGLAISAIRRVLRVGARALENSLEGNPLGAGDYGDSGIDARRPQIPRVAESNTAARLAEVARLAKEMGAPNINASRLVRRDGYVLEPVVSPKVLRAIPDNRDMEGATYLLRINDVPSIGQEELGLLSNTGVTNVSWVLPGGSLLSLEKVRPLTVGERRKLGRTVNAAMSMDNSTNPSARLQEVVEQTGDGIKYSEKFNGIARPHELVKDKNGRRTEKWVRELFSKKPNAELGEARETSSTAEVSDRIDSLSEALQHIADGGSLAKISPKILQQVLTENNMFKRQSMGNGLEKYYGPNGRSYLLRQARSDFSHLDDSFASDFQQHLGIESPDVYLIGNGKRSSYLMDSVQNVFQGRDIDKDVSLQDVSPKKMAALLVSDFVNGTNNRNPSTLSIIKDGENTTVATSEFKSELTELSKISIVARQKENIGKMDGAGENGVYGLYFKELQTLQKGLFLKEIKQLLVHARAFNFVNYKQRLSRNGVLSDSELTHLEVVGTIVKQRLDMLQNQEDVLIAMLGGKK